MRLSYLLFTILLGSTISSGCDLNENKSVPVQGGGTTGQVPSSPAPPATQTAPIPSEKATGVWNQSEVEQYLKQNLKLTEVSLAKAEKDDYTGTGKGADGLSYTLSVKQVPGGIACKFQNSGGSSGRISFGNPVP
jgi:hypothetical protein